MSTFAFLFTDIEGSTALVRSAGEEKYGALREAHDGLIRAQLARHDDTEVDSPGDGFFAIFSSPRACVAAVVDMQRALSSKRWPDGVELRVRMGVHAGEAAETPAGRPAWFSSERRRGKASSRRARLSIPRRSSSWRHGA